MIYFIRSVYGLVENKIQEPRTRPLLRRSLDGSKCIVAFEPGTEPEGWPEPMTAYEVRAILNAPEQEGIWWVAVDS